MLALGMRRKPRQISRWLTGDSLPWDWKKIIDEITNIAISLDSAKRNSSQESPPQSNPVESDIKILMGHIRQLTTQISDLQEAIGGIKHRLADIESQERINELRWERREGPRGDTKYGT